MAEQNSARGLSRRRFLRLLAFGMGTSVVGSGGSLYYAVRIEPFSVATTRLELPIGGLDRAFDGYRLAQISDIHMDGKMTAAHLAYIAALVNDWRPDAIALTGDFVTITPLAPHLDALRQSLPLFRASDGVFAVLGNHDYWTDAAAVRATLTASGLLEIGNAVHTLQHGAGRLHLCGVDDVWENKARLDIVTAALPAGEVALLLCHEPDYADTVAATGRFSAQFSGHSHGGQVWIPYVGPPVLPYLGEKYPAGYYRVGDMHLYTNRGVGTVSPRVRLNCRPEITFFTLRSA
jgi:hypothetical protein